MSHCMRKAGLKQIHYPLSKIYKVKNPGTEPGNQKNGNLKEAGINGRDDGCGQPGRF